MESGCLATDLFADGDGCGRVFIPPILGVDPDGMITDWAAFAGATGFGRLGGAAFGKTLWLAGGFEKAMALGSLAAAVAALGAGARIP